MSDNNGIRMIHFRQERRRRFFRDHKWWWIGISSTLVVIAGIVLIVLLYQSGRVPTQVTVVDNHGVTNTVTIDVEPTGAHDMSHAFDRNQDITFILSNNVWIIHQFPDQAVPLILHTRLVSNDGTQFLVTVVLDNTGNLKQFAINKCTGACPY